MSSSFFTKRRFLPLFITQFLGAFNDNLFKNALVILIAYRLTADNSGEAQILVTIAAGLFILPFFLFSAIAGQLADKYDRARLARDIKLAEIIIMVLASLALFTSSVPLLLFILFCLGTQSAFFGPIKYALLPQHLQENELIAANAYVEAGTFLAILTGTIAGGVLILTPSGITLVSVAMLLCALIGYLTSRMIPAAPSTTPELAIRWNLWRETWRIIGQSRSHTRVFRSIVGISWFWLVGATFLAQFPTYVKDVLHANEHVVTLFLTLFSLGIGLGSLLCNRLLRGMVESTFVPLAALGLSAFTVDLYFASSAFHTIAQTDLFTLGEFFAMPGSKRILLDLLLISICGGVYIVPLYAIVQHFSDPAFRARIIAANNVMNVLFMVVSAIGIVIMLSLGFSIPQVFLTVAIANGLVAIYIATILPDAVARSLMRIFLRLLYRVEIHGLDHFKAAGERVLIIANHTSFLDAALIAAFLPDRITFAVNTHIAQRWWIKPFLGLVDACPLDPTNPLATKTLIDTIRKNRKCMIFPEGRITVTGSLMKVYEGPGMIADKSDALILPIRIDGAQYTPFSRLRGKVRLRWFPKITLTVLPPRRFIVADDIKGRARRQAAGQQLYDVMSQMMFESSHYREPLFASLLSAGITHGMRHIIVEDVERRPLSYAQFISRAAIIGRLITRHSKNEPFIGILLPTMVSTSLTFFGLHSQGKSPAMLNFSSGVPQVVAACQTALIRTVVTSKRFVELSKQEPLIEALEQAGIKVMYLETLREHITIADKILALLNRVFPSMTGHKSRHVQADSPAVILFTSGSEGTPKGVVLSHANIQANRFQLASTVDFGPQDIVFNCLPMFHSFGLTGGTLLPILSGLKTFYYPSPLHYRIVPELVYDTNATIIFGTDTFLAGYAKYAHPYDFHSVRYIFAGAERLKDETRKIWSEKFGVRIFEGYGATETSPVLSTSTPMHNKAGTVGRFMPGITYRIDSVPGIDEGGQLWVQGPNIMLGYLRSEAPGKLEPLTDGWYDTGDIVAVDDAGYITIKGRTKRFAKIGGEMVSLTAVETAIQSLWPDYMHAVVSLPDEKKGEQLVLLTTHPNPSSDPIIKHFRSCGITELSIPRRIIAQESIPLLGTGKTDYQTAKQIALSAINA